MTTIISAARGRPAARIVAADGSAEAATPDSLTTTQASVTIPTCSSSLTAQLQSHGDVMGLSDVGADATELEHLDALIAGLAQAFDDSPAGAKAQTAAQYRAAIERRSTLKAAVDKRSTKADELAARRDARIAAADEAASAAGGGS